MWISVHRYTCTKNVRQETSWFWALSPPFHQARTWKFNVVHSWSMTPTYPELFMVLESYAVPTRKQVGKKAHWSLVISSQLWPCWSASSLRVQQLSAASALGLQHGYFYQGLQCHVSGLMYLAAIPFWSRSCFLPSNTTWKYDSGSHVQNPNPLAPMKPAEFFFPRNCGKSFYFNFLQVILSLPAISLLY